MALILDIAVDDKGTATINKFEGNFSKAADKMQKKTTGMSDRFKSLFGGIANIVKKAAIGIAASFAAITAAAAAVVKSVASMGDNIAKMAKRVGASTEFLSSMSHAVQLAGGSIKDFEMGMRRLARNMTDFVRGLSTSVDAFKRLGVSPLDAQGNLKTLEQIFWEIVPAFNAMTSETDKLAIAQELFGRGGAMLIPLFKEGKTAIKEYMKEAKDLGIVWNADQARMAEKFTDTMLRFKQTLTGLKMTIGLELMPQAEKLINDFIKWFLSNKEKIKTGILDTFDIMAMVIKKVGTAAKWTMKMLTPVINLLKTFADMENVFDKMKEATDDFHGDIPALGEAVPMPGGSFEKESSFISTIIPTNDELKRAKEFSDMIEKSMLQNVYTMVDAMEDTEGFAESFNEIFNAQATAHSDMILQMNDEERAQYELRKYLGEGYEAILDEQARKAITLLKVEEEIARAKKQAYISTAQTLVQAFAWGFEMVFKGADNFMSNMAILMLRGFAQIFMQLASAFAALGALLLFTPGAQAQGAKMLVQAAVLASIAGAMYGIASALETKLQEEEYQQAIASGATAVVSDTSTGTETVSSASQTNVTVVIEGDMIGDSDFVEKTLIPLITEAVKDKDAYLISSGTV